MYIDYDFEMTVLHLNCELKSLHKTHVVNQKWEGVQSVEFGLWILKGKKMKKKKTLKVCEYWSEKFVGTLLHACWCVCMCVCVCMCCEERGRRTTKSSCFFFNLTTSTLFRILLINKIGGCFCCSVNGNKALLGKLHVGTNQYPHMHTFVCVLFKEKFYNDKKLVL